MNRTSIAIDGPAGVGKSTIAKMLAEKLGYLYVDTGALYRSIAVFLSDRGITPESHDEEKVKEQVITSKDIIRYIKSLKGMLMTYQNSQNVPATKSQIRNVIDELNLLEAAL